MNTRPCQEKTARSPEYRSRISGPTMPHSGTRHTSKSFSSQLSVALRETFGTVSAYFIVCQPDNSFCGTEFGVTASASSCPSRPWHSHAGFGIQLRSLFWSNVCYHISPDSPVSHQTISPMVSVYVTDLPSRTFTVIIRQMVWFPRQTNRLGPEPAVQFGP